MIRLCFHLTFEFEARLVAENLCRRQQLIVLKHRHAANWGQSKNSLAR